MKLDADEEELEEVQKALAKNKDLLKQKPAQKDEEKDRVMQQVGHAGDPDAGTDGMTLLEL